MNQNRTENEPGPSTSNQASRSAPQASTSPNYNVGYRTSQLSRIPRLARRVENPQVNPIASTRIRSRNLQINQNEPAAPHLRPQNMTIRGDVSSRINAPISSRTRSQFNANLLEPNSPQNSRELRSGQRNGLSRIRHLPPRSALTHSDNNNDQPQQLQPRRRRIPFYSPPPLTVRNNQRSFMNYQELLRRFEDDSDSSSSSRNSVNPYTASDPEEIQLSPEVSESIPLNRNERGMTEPLRVDVSDDSD